MGTVNYLIANHLYRYSFGVAAQRPTPYFNLCSGSTVDKVGYKFYR